MFTWVQTMIDAVPEGWSSGLANAKEPGEKLIGELPPELARIAVAMEYAIVSMHDEVLAHESSPGHQKTQASGEMSAECLALETKQHEVMQHLEALHYLLLVEIRLQFKIPHTVNFRVRNEGVVEVPRESEAARIEPVMVFPGRGSDRSN